MMFTQRCNHHSASNILAAPCCPSVLMSKFTYVLHLNSICNLRPCSAAFHPTLSSALLQIMPHTLALLCLCIADFWQHISPPYVITTYAWLVTWAWSITAQLLRMGAMCGLFSARLSPLIATTRLYNTFASPNRPWHQNAVKCAQTNLLEIGVYFDGPVQDQQPADAITGKIIWRSAHLFQKQ